MKDHRTIRIAIASVLAGTALYSAFGQGSLTPPAGPAGPTMRTLTQVEPRIPLAAGSPGVTVNPNGGFAIGAAGSYYLTSNLSVSINDGIQIKAGDVTLDLMGFTVSSTAPGPASGTGIKVDANLTAVSIRNGKVRSAATLNVNAGTTNNVGFQNGISGSPSAISLSVSDVEVSGVQGLGIVDCEVVERCRVNNAQFGINGCRKVSDCSVDRCKFGISAGVQSLVTRCRAGAYGPGSKAIAAEESTISDCSASATGANCVAISGGTSAGFGSAINNCQAWASTDGATPGGTITGIGNLGGQVSNCRVVATAFDGSAVGIDATEGVVSHCIIRPSSSSGHVALKAAIADACAVSSGTVTATNRYNMP